MSNPLKPVDNPDTIIDLKIDISTLPQGVYQNKGYERRQVFDFIIKTIVKEYRQEQLIIAFKKHLINLNGLKGL